MQGQWSGLLTGTSNEFGAGVGVHQGLALSPQVVMQETTRAGRGEGLWDLLYADDLVITAESEEEAVRKFVWKRYRPTMLMVMGRETAVRPQRGRYPCGVCGNGVGANSIRCQSCERGCHQRCSGLRYLSDDDVISCGERAESAERNRIYCAWSKWRELASLLVNHSIPPEEREKVYCSFEACIAVSYRNWALTERLERLLASYYHKY